jgi:hypothetical protein
LRQAIGRLLPIFELGLQFLVGKRFDVRFHVSS